MSKGVRFVTRIYLIFDDNIIHTPEKFAPKILGPPEL